MFKFLTRKTPLKDHERFAQIYDVDTYGVAHLNKERALKDETFRKNITELVEADLVNKQKK